MYVQFSLEYAYVIHPPHRSLHDNWFPTLQYEELKTIEKDQFEEELRAEPGVLGVVTTAN